eukprot:1252266-Pleurochrysis_carterae.AAC.1
MKRRERGWQREQSRDRGRSRSCGASTASFTPTTQVTAANCSGPVQLLGPYGSSYCGAGSITGWFAMQAACCPWAGGRRELSPSPTDGLLPCDNTALAGRVT